VHVSSTELFIYDLVLETLFTIHMCYI